MPGPIRVLQVFAKLNRGGAETMIMNLYRSIDRSKVQFDFVVHTAQECDYDQEIKILGGRIYQFPLYKGKNHAEYKKKWNEFFEKHLEYSIVHGHVRSTASIYLKLAKHKGITTIAHSHNISSGTGINGLIKNLYQYPIRYIADYLFACSKDAGIWLFGKKACNKDNFFVLNNAIDAKRFIFNMEVRKQQRIDLELENKFVIGHVGRFHSQKNHEFLINIFEKVYKINTNSKLLLIGDGELRRTIENKVEELKLSNSVIFTGVRADIPDLFQAMDVFVFPSLYEGLGVVLIEAQASGLRCITSEQVVPIEAQVTSLLEYISLSRTANDWAEKLMQINKELINDELGRLDMYNAIKNAGFDIGDTTQWLEDFYVKVSKKNEKQD